MRLHMRLLWRLIKTSTMETTQEATVEAKQETGRKTMSCFTTGDSRIIRITTRVRLYRINFALRTTWRRLLVRGGKAGEHLISQIG